VVWAAGPVSSSFGQGAVFGPGGESVKLATTVFAVAMLASSCGIYAPTLLDCRVKCSDEGGCPAGTRCETGFCRPDDATGFCNCTAGEERPCGGGPGECRPGLQRCLESQNWSACLGEVKPSAELCDNKDNDCNGAVDDQVTDAPPCGRTRGVCAGTNQTCLDGAYSGSCADSEYGPDFETIETRCDQKDNDCDGVVDGRPAARLADTSTSYSLAGFDGGFALGWAEEVDGGSLVRGRFYDAALNPAGPVTTLGFHDAGVVVRAAAHGQRAWFIWESRNRVEFSGASMDLGQPGVAVPLPGLPRSDARTLTLKIGANERGLFGAYPANGGLGLLQWPSDGGAYTFELVVPPDPGFQSLNFVAVSSGARAVAFDVTLATDAGTTTEDRVMSMDRTRYVNAFVWSEGSLVDTAQGLRSAHQGSCRSFDIFNNCFKSYLRADFNVWNLSAGAVDIRVLPDPNAIRAVHATSTPADWALVWTENTSLYVGTPVEAALSVRSVSVNLEGAVATSAQIANAGGAFNAIVYDSELDGRLSGLLICNP
jgi:Putative metal-binding motif